MTCGAATDTGLQRERNEDRYWIDAERGIFLVVDGVGGHAGGDLAAETAVDAIRETSGGRPLRRSRPRTASAPRSPEPTTGSTPSRRATRELRGMACVLTLALVEDGEITIGHVGDSRLYLVWNGALRKLTSDHSPVGEDEDAGELSEPDAMRHPRRNEVFRDVGSRPRLANDADFIEIRHCRFPSGGGAAALQRRADATMSLPRRCARSWAATTAIRRVWPRNWWKRQIAREVTTTSPPCSSRGRSIGAGAE